MRAKILIMALLVTSVGARPIPPCPGAKADTTGWRTERFSERLVFSLPSWFKRDRAARYVEGGRRWTDGDRGLALIVGFWGDTSFGKDDKFTDGYSECVDTLAGTPFRLITSHGSRAQRYYATALEDSAYHLRGTPLRGYANALTASSPSRADLRLFLEIFRTLRADSTTPWSK